MFFYVVQNIDKLIHECVRTFHKLNIIILLYLISFNLLKNKLISLLLYLNTCINKIQYNNEV